MSKKIYSETSYYVQQEDGLFKDDLGNSIEIQQNYVDKILKSANNFEKTEKINRTELAELFINNSRIAMTVGFYKKPKTKTKTAYKKEVTSKIEEFKNAKVSDLENLVMGLINNPLVDTIEPEFREMRGRHHGSIDDMGRVHFVDMEIEKNETKDYDNRLRQVDPRTLEYVIVDNVKYVLK